MAEEDLYDETEDGPYELPEEPTERVRDLVEEVLDALDLDAEVEVRETDDEILVDVDGDDLGLLIGRRGQTIDALQLLCFRAAFRGSPDRKRVVVDAAGYRARRRTQLERDAERAAARALESGSEIELDSMTASERRIIHDALKDKPGVETFSEGEEPDRYVVVAPLNED